MDGKSGTFGAVGAVPGTYLKLTLHNLEKSWAMEHDP
jgi:hypothetical protein